MNAVFKSAYEQKFYSVHPDIFKTIFSFFAWLRPEKRLIRILP
jgi:hypothetical protein